MYWYHYFNLVAILVFLLSFLYHLIRLIKAGNPKEFSKPSGDVASAVRYSFTGAMSPTKKESAYLHLPTYTAGIFFHLGTFTAIAIYIISWFITFNVNILTVIIATFLFITGISGIGIFIKRIIKKELKEISNPDDYLSNILVTLFQLITGIFLLLPSTSSIFYIISALVLFYFPLGKLKHALYFFSARYHLGLFYGWRGVWPPKQLNFRKS